MFVELETLLITLRQKAPFTETSHLWASRRLKQPASEEGQIGARCAMHRSKVCHELD